jgi:hypothetical protein
VGVQQPATDTAVVTDLLDELGVPRHLVDIEKAEAPGFDDLDSRIRPTVGGLKIQRLAGPGQLANCSLGFPARRPAGEPFDGDPLGFVTNSHCTAIVGHMDDETLPPSPTTQFGQPTAADVVGYESKDPTFFNRGDCPRTFSCRYSDSAFISYHNAAEGVTHSRGKIANATLNTNRLVDFASLP